MIKIAFAFNNQICNIVERSEVTYTNAALIVPI